MSKQTKIRRDLEEFFYFVIWDSISQIIIESAGNIEQSKIKSLQTDLCTLFIDSIIQQQSHTQFKFNFASIIKSSGFISELMEEYIVETLSLFRLRLFNIFTREQLQNESIELEQQVELQNSIEDYVILSYLDKFVLSNVIKILLYSSRISFAEVNEFRIRLIEIFREILDGNTSLKELTEYLESELNRMALDKIIRDFISASIIGYFTTIMRFDNYVEILEQMKKGIINKITIFSDTSFIQKQRIDSIILWLKNEVIDPFFDLIRGSNVTITPSTESITSSIESAYRKQIERKISLDMITERLNSLEESINIQRKNRPGNRFKFSKKPYFSNKFRVVRKDTKNKIPLGPEKLSEMEKVFEENTDLTPEKVIEMEFQILLYLATFLDNELSFDYQLDNFYNLIKQNRHGTNQIYL
ncbi:MAG: hypothetical protein ACTSRE_05680 [Promethearchaeota archaeon]